MAVGGRQGSVTEKQKAQAVLDSRGFLHCSPHHPNVLRTFGVAISIKTTRVMGLGGQESQYHDDEITSTDGSEPFYTSCEPRSFLSPYIG